MRFLIDTHVLLWFINDDPQLSSKAKELIAEPANGIFVSVASLWEMAIKSSTGKLKLLPDFEGFINEHLIANNFQVLPIEVTHLNYVERLPFHHRDPFDRIIVSQSVCERMPLITADNVFDSYEVEIIWK